MRCFQSPMAVDDRLDEEGHTYCSLHRIDFYIPMALSHTSCPVKRPFSYLDQQRDGRSLYLHSLLSFSSTMPFPSRLCDSHSCASDFIVMACACWSTAFSCVARCYPRVVPLTARASNCIAVQLMMSLGFSYDTKCLETL
jgi:hypothetical protein